MLKIELSKFAKYLKKSVILIFMAFITASILKVLVLNIFIIPSSSMEDTIMEGDGIVVSKIHYGAQLFNIRLPGFSDIKRNDIIVFLNPLNNNENLLKRCIGLPGEKLSIIKDQVIINSHKIEQPINSLNHYLIEAVNSQLLDSLLNKYKPRRVHQENANSIIVAFKPQDAILFNNEAGIKVFHRTEILGNEPGIFPSDVNLGWNKDNYEPITIPKKGLKLSINRSNILLYKKIITQYEKNIIEVNKSGIYINHKKSNFYIFKNDYYFFMGDNRNSSYDSRYLGFVPKKLIIGKAIYKIFSSNLNNVAYTFSRL